MLAVRALFLDPLVFLFGPTFEAPLACVLLVKLGIMSCDFMAQKRRWVLVGAFVVGAVLTLPDIISQVMLAIPVYLPFEPGVLVVRRFEGKGFAKVVNN